MTLSRRQLLGAASAAGFFASHADWARAQSIEMTRVITGFAAGGTADVISRRAGEKIRPGYARNVLVENKTGAGGLIALQFVKNAAPDGAHILMTPMSMLCIYPHIYKKLAYDPVADLTPVSLGAVFDLAFGVGPQVPASVKTLQDYLAWAKANPKLASFGIPAAGSISHFAGVLLGRAGGIELQQVAYRGTLPAIQEMMGGQVPAVCGPIGEFMAFLSSGRCRLLGTTGAQRSKFTPTIPTFAEQGLKDMVFPNWFGFYLPAKTPPDVVQRLNTALVAALAAPDVVDGLAAIGLESASSSPAELALMQRTDVERWAPLVKSIGFSAES